MIENFYLIKLINWIDKKIRNGYTKNKCLQPLYKVEFKQTTKNIGIKKIKKTYKLTICKSEDHKDASLLKSILMKWLKKFFIKITKEDKINNKKTTGVVKLNQIKK